MGLFSHDDKKDEAAAMPAADPSATPQMPVDSSVAPAQDAGMASEPTASAMPSMGGDPAPSDPTMSGGAMGDSGSDAGAAMPPVTEGQGMGESMPLTPPMPAEPTTDAGMAGGGMPPVGDVGGAMPPMDGSAPAPEAPAPGSDPTQPQV